MRIYAISIAYDIDMEGAESGMATLKNCDCVGFFTNEADAVRAVEENMGDIWETTNKVAIIEAVDEGVYGCDPTSRHFFRWGDDMHYHEEPWPEALEHICGFAIL